MATVAPNKAGLGSVEPAGTGPSAVLPDPAESATAGPATAGPSAAVPDPAESATAGPSAAGSATARPSAARLATVGPDPTPSAVHPIGEPLRAELWPRQRPAARLTGLILGLGLYGLSEALMLAPAVGVDPWDVFHTGLAGLTGIPVGTVLIVISVAVLLLWIPLRQRPGIGTVANVVIIGSVVDLILGDMPAPHTLWLRWAMFLSGVLLNAIATGVYIGAGLGPGPRDGLTTALAARGHSIRLMRTGIELSVLLIGWLLGGNVGLGTLVYALAIGPLLHVAIPKLSLKGALTQSPSRPVLPSPPASEPTPTSPSVSEPTPAPVPVTASAPVPAAALPDPIPVAPDRAPSPSLT